MTRSLIIVALFALAACDTAGTMQTASTPRGSAEARFITAIENNGCMLNQANTVRVANEAGITPDEFTSISRELLESGRMEESIGASLRLTTGACAA